MTRRKLTPAQRRVLLRITGSDRPAYLHDSKIRRKLVQRGYVTLETGCYKSGSCNGYNLTSKGRAALKDYSAKGE
jgi:hypothetical protein